MVVVLVVEEVVGGGEWVLVTLVVVSGCLCECNGGGVWLCGAVRVSPSSDGVPLPRGRLLHTALTDLPPDRWQVYGKP